MTVVVVGSANLDLIVGVPALPVPGQTVLGTDVVVRAGGEAANQAVAAARVGADVTFFGAVGSDPFGDSLCTLLDGAGLGLQHVQRLPGSTGVALIIVDDGARNVIAVASGANLRLGAELPGLALRAGDVLLTQLEIPVRTCLAAAERARAAGARVIANVAPMSDADDADLHELLQRTDVLVANEGEALGLARAPETAARTEGWEAIAHRLRRLGPAAAVVTLGAQGAVLADADGALRVPSPQVAAIDSTGAGDAFCGALAAGLAAGAELRAAVRRACLAGALATTALSTQEALPTAAQLAALDGGAADAS